MSANIIFRADAHSDLGTGHVIRCLTLAEVLRQRGCGVSFISRELPGHVIPLVRERELECIALPAMSQPAGNETDAVQTREVVERGLGRVSCLVVDHYLLDARWEHAMRAVTDCVLAIDDLADRDHDCDVLLDQNDWPAAEGRYANRLPANAKQLLGTRFAILRPEFRNARLLFPRSVGPVRRLLVTYGGNDRMDMTMRTLEALDALRLGGLTVDVVIGAANPHRARIESYCAGRPGLHAWFNTGRMPELMAGADLCIGAGGTTSWERLAVGLPALVVALAANQFEIAAHLDNLGVIRYLGYAPDINQAQLQTAIVESIADTEWRRRAAAAGQIMVDGLGVYRVADAVLELVR